MTTQEPPDSACEVRRVHSVAFEGKGGTVTFGLETKRPLEGSGYDAPSVTLSGVMYGAGMACWERYVVRVGGEEVHLTEMQLRAMLRAVRAAFLKAD